MASHATAAAYLDLAQRWARGTAILFAVGAVSGTVLSFELGLLWPASWTSPAPSSGCRSRWKASRSFSKRSSSASTSTAGTACGRRPISSPASGRAERRPLRRLRRHRQRVDEHTRRVRVVDGSLIEVDPFAAMFNPAAGAQVVHMMLAAYCAVGIAVAGIHARLLLRDPSHRLSPARLRDRAPRRLACRHSRNRSPATGQARCSHARSPRSSRRSRDISRPERMRRCTSAAFPTWRRTRRGTRSEIPGGLSFLAYGDPTARVVGLNDIPRDDGRRCSRSTSPSR